jgi:uncharacterized membrane protein YhdT
LLGVCSIFLLHFEVNFHGVIVEIGGIPHVVWIQVFILYIDNKEITSLMFFIETLNGSNSSFFCNSLYRQSNCTMPNLPPEEYFEWERIIICYLYRWIFSNYVLRRSDSLDNLGSPSWSLSLCLLLAWILVGVCIIQGIKSSGKVKLLE